jgi:hypothetical protein
MQALKGLVIGLGILVVVSFALLLYGFYSKLSNQGAKIFASSDRGESSEIAVFGSVHISLPGGCRMEEMHPMGTRLFLRIGPAAVSGSSGGCERIVVIDAETGRQLGTLSIGP